jgi:hypothetical protein
MRRTERAVQMISDALSIRDIADLWAEEPEALPAPEIKAKLWRAFWRGEITLTSDPHRAAEIDRDTLAPVFAAEDQGPHGFALKHPYIKGLNESAEAKRSRADFEQLSAWAADDYPGMSNEFRDRLDYLYVPRASFIEYRRAIDADIPAFWAEPISLIDAPSAPQTTQSTISNSGRRQPGAGRPFRPWYAQMVRYFAKLDANGMLPTEDKDLLRHAKAASSGPTWPPNTSIPQKNSDIVKGCRKARDEVIAKRFAADAAGAN